MMMVIRRLNRIFKPDGRALIVSMDHAAIFGPTRGLIKPEKTIAAVITGGADAIMTSYGVARSFAREMASIGLVLRSDGAPTIHGRDVPAPILFGVDEALRLGADALCVSAYPASDKEMPTEESLASITREAHVWGLPVMGEIVPGGMNAGSEYHTLEYVKLAARWGLELGADWVKVPYVENFNEVVESCYKPVVILGGAKRGAVKDILVEMRAAMDAGAYGGVIGRNIWEWDDPEAMTRALVAIIHQDASAEEAVKILGVKD
jgi:DhnA family fructose-bisphosphate aldolase class Ia